MTKTFVVEPGHDVLVGHVWHGPGLTVMVEPGQRVEVYVTPNGRRGACIGTYSYDTLQLGSPPTGLRRGI